MEPQRPFRSKPRQRPGKLSRSRAVESPNDSSSDDKSDDEPQNLGSRLKLLPDRRKSAKSFLKDFAADKPSAKTDEPENTIVQIESATEPAVKPHPAAPPPQVAKESSIARTIKRKFGFFRRSSSEKPKSTEDVEAAGTDNTDTPESRKRQTLDVVVDVHQESESQRSRVIKKSVASSRRDDEERLKSSPEIEALDLIEEFHEDEPPAKGGFFGASGSDVDEEQDKSIEELLANEVLPASGGESSRRRKRWDKPELRADELVEDLKRPKRRQWTKGSASAEIREASGKKIVVPKRSATAEPEKPVRPRSAKYVGHF